MWVDPGSAIDGAMSTVASATLLSYLIQWAKKSAWFPWLTAEKRTLLRVINAVTAAVAALGVHVVFDTEAGVLTLTGLTVGSLAHGLWEWGKQWAFQQAAYDGVVSRSQQSS